MALYDYTMYIVRKSHRGDITSDIFQENILEKLSDDEARILGKVDCYYGESTNSSNHSSILQVFSIEFDDKGIERVLNYDPSSLFDWIRKLIIKTDPDYMFISGGVGSSYYQIGKIRPELVFTQLGELVDKGIVNYTHPVMYFSSRIMDGDICNKSQHAPRYRFEAINDRGCLLMLIQINETGSQAEILDPGIIYPEIQRYFTSKSS